MLDPGEKVLNFAAHLSTPTELSGVLNRALAVLPAMLHRRGFTQSESTQAALMEFREMTDPLAAWLDRFTVLSPEGMVSRKDLAISFNAASEAAGRHPMTPKAFCAAVRRLRPTLTEAQKSVCGQMQWAFLGLALPGATHSNSHDSHHSSHSFQISLRNEEMREEEKELKIADGVNGVSDVSDAKLTQVDAVPCFACRGTRFWRSIHGSTVCGTCHPPLTPDLVEEWIG